jgi:hypothetical protein
LRKDAELVFERKKNQLNEEQRQIAKLKKMIDRGDECKLTTQEVEKAIIAFKKKLSLTTNQVEMTIINWLIDCNSNLGAFYSFEMQNSKESKIKSGVKD